MFNNQGLNNESIEKIINECEQYRDKLIKHCQLHFSLGYEDASDCVQETYLALCENLNNGVEIHNYRSWLYKVTMNNYKKIIKDKLKRNEYSFTDSEIKDSVIENTAIYNPDYIDEMISDETIEQTALRILSKLNDEEKQLYVERYWKSKTFVEISKELNLDPSSVGKRHARLKKKIIKMIKKYEENL